MNRRQISSSTVHEGEGFNSEEAVKRASLSLKQQDYLLAARSSMNSLVEDVRNSQALQARMTRKGAAKVGGGGLSYWSDR